MLSWWKNFRYHTLFGDFYWRLCVLGLLKSNHRYDT